LTRAFLVDPGGDNRLQGPARVRKKEKLETSNSILLEMKKGRKRRRHL
jgi:hypothetical protein